MNYKVVLAGLTRSTIYPAFDFETYSIAGYEWSEEKGKWCAPNGFPKGKPGLLSIGAAKYAEHESTEVLSLAYDLRDGLGPLLWTPAMTPPVRIFNYLADPTAIISAYHSLFEFFIWHYVCHLRMGWPVLNLNQLRCDQGKAAAWGMPGNLDKTAKVLHEYGH